MQEWTTDEKKKSGYKVNRHVIIVTGPWTAWPFSYIGQANTSQPTVHRHYAHYVTLDWV